MKRLLLAILLLPSLAQAQLWLASDILARTTAPKINLQAKDGDTVKTVATVERTWIERSVSITQRMVREYEMDAPTVYITYGKAPNAFVTLGKQREPIMAVNTEMLRMVGHNEDMLAAVIGHELGHLKANHVTDGASRQAFITLLGVLLGAAVDVNQAKKGVNTQGAGTRLGALGGGLVNAKFNRDQEREADDLGIRAMARAGFNPSAAPALWRMMASYGGGGQGFWLDSHPSHKEREQAMEVAAAALPQTSPQTTVAITSTPQPPNLDLPTVRDPWPTSAFRNFALTPQEVTASTPSNFRRGAEAYRAGRHTEAIEAMTAAADSDGDERAMAFLYGAYASGRYVARDEAKARDYAERSANKGFGPGIHALGEIAARGAVTPALPMEASELFILAHNRGWPPATSRLATLYLSGKGGVSRDPVKARDLASLSAERNDTVGKTLYGALLRDGVGGPADPVKAFQLLKEAAEAAPTNGFANYQLAISYDKGLGTAPDKTAAIDAYKKAKAGGVLLADERLKALSAD